MFDCLVFSKMHFDVYLGMKCYSKFIKHVDELHIILMHDQV
jgi:hypothetical protein